MSDHISPAILGLTAQIVSAHVSKNKVETDALPSLIQTVFRSLVKAGEAEAPAAPVQMPAVPVKRSVFPDHIVCLEDGKKLKMLKRHLQTSYNMTPEAYRTKWGLPKDYPMVAPTYAARRSQLAKNIGLGLKPKAVVTEQTEPAPEPSRRVPRPVVGANPKPNFPQRLPKTASFRAVVVGGAWVLEEVGDGVGWRSNTGRPERHSVADATN